MYILVIFIILNERQKLYYLEEREPPVLISPHRGSSFLNVKCKMRNLPSLNSSHVPPMFDRGLLEKTI